MHKYLQYAGQAVIYAGVMALIGFFADTPHYQYFKPDEAMIKVAFAHAGESKDGCRKQTKEEQSKIARNMRKKLVCSRQRVPLVLEIKIDGKMVYSGVLEPSGFRGDGPSQVYFGFPVAIGKHDLLVQMRDTKRTEGFDWVAERKIDLKPLQHFVTQFRPEYGGFIFQ